MVRPVAAKDYWGKSRLLRFIACGVFNSVLLNRTPLPSEGNPLDELEQVLLDGQSLILFPEGTRGGREGVGKLRSGIYHLAKRVDRVEFVPVWLENFSRILPKGEFLPVPILCAVSFGDAITLRESEEKQRFLQRVSDAMTELRELQDA